MKPELEQLQHITRRSFLKGTGQFCLGAIAMADMFSPDAQGATKTASNPLIPRSPHFAPKVKRVIYLHMSGLTPPRPV